MNILNATAMQTCWKTEKSRMAFSSERGAKFYHNRAG